MWHVYNTQNDVYRVKKINLKMPTGGTVVSQNPAEQQRELCELLEAICRVNERIEDGAPKKV